MAYYVIIEIIVVFHVYGLVLHLLLLLLLQQEKHGEVPDHLLPLCKQGCIEALLWRAELLLGATLNVVHVLKHFRSSGGVGSRSSGPTVVYPALDSVMDTELGVGDDLGHKPLRP